MIFFKKAYVTRKQHINDSYILFEIKGTELQGTNISFGDFFQISLGGMKVRSYTPIEWDSDRGIIKFLYYCHGPGLAASWFNTVEEDSECFIYGPRRSLNSRKLDGPVTLIGDETSLGLFLSTKTSAFPLQIENIYLLVNSVDDAIEINWNYSMGAKVLQSSLESFTHILEALPLKGKVVLTGGSKMVQYFKQKYNVIGVPYWTE